jgi:hypothetical protein
MCNSWFSSSQISIVKKNLKSSDFSIESCCYQHNEDQMQKTFNPKLEFVFSFPLKVA